ncbi:MAG: hypothetical protein H6863_03635 [Rhodospirillales bacterium]|nr:hypothetical protein [Rhodospirillales bacterium]MCB9980213.1 hypothetical protein [Rhodospirillales bacterium]
MLRTLRLALLSGFCVLSFPAFAETAQEISSHGNWTAYYFMENGEKVCYMASEPDKHEGKYTSRGDIAAMITHWPAKDSKDVFSYVAGYDYKKGSDVTVSVGGETFTLFTQGEMAWAADESTDKRLMQAIKKGSTMVVKGTSARGTLTTDTYSLKGSSAAYDAISKTCRVR